MDSERLVELAREAKERAYAPYSGFKVGAAVLTRRGAVHVGCNVENASLGLTVCAERVAVFRAVSEGDVEIEAVVIVTDGEEPVAPCGACRQVLREFGTTKVMSQSAGTKKKKRTWTLDELLPVPFDGSTFLTSGKDSQRT
jgi:cytidine deaminase